MVAACSLEIINYIEHYGLERARGAAAIAAPAAPTADPAIARFLSAKSCVQAAMNAPFVDQSDTDQIENVNLVFQPIGRELHASVSGLQWTIDAYALVLASLLMFSGSTADRIGRRKTFQAGLAVFTVGSLLCSLAPGLGWLVAFRMIQAVGGSMMNPVAMSIITNTFTRIV